MKGISDLIMRPGMINLDFSDVKTVMGEMGMAMMGTGYAEGEGRAIEAAEAAVRSPLLDDVDLQGARGILVNITANAELTLGEFNDVGTTIEEFASDNATVVVGTVIDESIGDELRVTVVAAGLGDIGMLTMPKKVVDNTSHDADKTTAPHLTDYNELDIPPAIRQRRAQTALAEKFQQEEPDSMDYLDVPAFLRRQAD